MENIITKHVLEHVEVWINNAFSFSADNEYEAIRELKAQLTY